jgi:hypothetical protein
VDTHLTYDVDYTLELIDGKRHLIPRNPEATVSPSRVYVKQTGLFRGDKMLSKPILQILRLVWVTSRLCQYIIKRWMVGRFMNDEPERMWKEPVLF